MFKVAGPFWAHATAGDNVFARLAKTGKKLLRRVLRQRELETTQREVPKPTWNLRSHTVKVDSTTSRLVGGLFPKQILQTQAAELRRQAALRLIRDARKVPVFAFVGLSLGLGGASSEQKSEGGSTEDVLYSGIRDLFKGQGVKGGLVEHGGQHFSLQTLQLGPLIGQGCNAAVFEARPSEAPSQPHQDEESVQQTDSSVDQRPDTVDSQTEVAPEKSPLIGQEENQPPTATTAINDDADDDEEDDFSIISEDDSDFSIIGEEEEEEEEEDRGMTRENLDDWVLYRLSTVHDDTSENGDDDDDSDIIILARDEGDLQSLPDLEDVAAELSWSSVTESVGDVGVDTADSRSDQSSASVSSAVSMSTTFTSDNSSSSSSVGTGEPEPAPNIGLQPGQEGAAPDEDFPLAVKMMYNYTVESKADHIYRAMAKEAIPALSNLQGPPDSSLPAVSKRLPPHPNIVTMYDVFVDQTPDLPEGQELYPSALPPRLNRDGGFGRNATMFLVMKKYTMTLNQYLTTHALDMRTRCVLFAQLMEGLTHLSAHGIAHRDLKSNNVLIDLSMGIDCPHLAITDFGSCLADAHYGLKLPYLTPDTDKGGNSALMAPEIKCAVAGPGSVLDYSRSDVWAAGTLAYEIFGELNPFYAGLDSRSYRHDQLPPLSVDVPEAVVKLMGAMLNRDPSQRPSSAVASTYLQLFLWAPPQLSPLSQQHGSNALWRVKEISHWLESLTMETVCQRVFGSGGVTRLELLMKSSFLSRVSRRDVVGVVSFEG